MDSFYNDVLHHNAKKCILAYNLSSKEMNAVEKIVSEKFTLIKTNLFTDLLAVPSVGVFINTSIISESELTRLFEYYFEGHFDDKSWVMVFMQPVIIPIALKESFIYVYKEDNIMQIYDQLCHIADVY